MDANDGNENKRNGIGNACEDGGVLHALLDELEAPVKGLHDEHHRIAQQDDGTGLDDVRPAAAAHIHKGTLERRCLILGHFDDKEGFAVLVARDLVDQQSAQQDQDNAGKVHQRTDPACIIKERTGEESDNRQLRAAGHEGGQHSGGVALALVADRARSHNTGDGAAGTDDEGDHGLAGQSNFLEDGIKNDRSAGHVAAVLQQGDHKVHDHDQRQETDDGAHTADDTLRQQCSKEGIGVLQNTCHPLLEHIDQRDQTGDGKTVCKLITLSDPGTDPRLRDLEHKEHDSSKDDQTADGIGQHGVDLIIQVLVAGEDLALFDLSNNAVDKFEALSVRRLNGLLVRQVDITLRIRCLLPSAEAGDSGLDHFTETFRADGNRLHHGAAQLLGQCGAINLVGFLLIDIALIQRDHDRDAQLQQLRGEEQAAAEIGRVHDVDDHIGVLILDIRTGDALLRGERGHGVRTGQIDRDQPLVAAAVDLLDGVLLLLDRNARPVADLFVAAGQRVEHGRFSAVGITCQCDSHTSLLLFYDPFPMETVNYSWLVIANSTSKGDQRTTTDRREVTRQ